MIISINAEKAGNFLTLTEDIFGNLTARIRFNGERLDAFHNDQKGEGCLLQLLLIIIVLEVLTQQEKEIKSIQINKEKSKTIFADGMILYTENPK